MNWSNRARTLRAAIGAAALAAVSIGALVLPAAPPAAAGAPASARTATAPASTAKGPRQIPQVRPQDPCNVPMLNQQILLKPSDVNSLLMRAWCDINESPGLSPAVSPGPNRKPPLSSLRQAATDLETVLKIDPQNAYARHDYAQAAYLLGYDDFAVAEYTKAVALNPGDARGYLGRGWAHSALCQMNEAEADFSTAVKLDASLAGEAASPQAMARQRGQCARAATAFVQATPNCPAKHIVAFSLSARIVLEDQWRKQHPGCP